jgi:hypothetical protein
MTRREIEDYLIERAIVEPDFRRELLSDPDRLLRDLGLPVGDDVKIRILEEEPKSFYLVLPRMIQEQEELNDYDLDGVAGGRNSQSGTFRFFKGYS